MFWWNAVYSWITKSLLESLWTYFGGHVVYSVSVSHGRRGPDYTLGPRSFRPDDCYRIVIENHESGMFSLQLLWKSIKKDVSKHKLISFWEKRVIQRERERENTIPKAMFSWNDFMQMHFKGLFHRFYQKVDKGWKYVPVSMF